MDMIQVRDVIKALRLCGWELLRVDGRFCQFGHPDASGIITISGRPGDYVNSHQLQILERELGRHFGVVLH
jgi:predicted RNA binding protein YcfA (HicA-like mRNA interferase family)